MRLRKIIYPLALVLTLTACANNNDNKEPATDEVSKAEENVSVTEDENQVEETKDTSSNENNLEKLDKTYYEYFDTVTTLLTYSDDKESFDKSCDILEEELAKYHKLYNSYDDFEGVNNFKTINDKAGIEPVKVDPEIIELI